MDITELAKDFQSVAEWQAYSEAQKKQVNSLMKKIRDLEELNKDLKKQNFDLSVDRHGSNSLQTNLLMRSDVETISDVQLKLLKNISFDRELTLEEAKKCEIFNKIILSHKAAPADVQTNAQPLTEAELISLVND